MTRRPIRLLTLLLFVTLSSTALADAPELRIVVHADNPVSVMTTGAVSEMFLLKSTGWEDGTNVVPIDQVSDAEVRRLFSENVLGRSTSAITKYWQRQIFSGQGIPPSQLSSDEAVLEYVRQNPGAVGYVSAGALLVRGVRSLKLSDLTTAADLGPFATADVRLAASSGPHSGAATEIVAHRGNVRILLTGSCGPSGQGRHALLQHRSPHETARVTTETSRWSDGSFSSSSRDRHTLAGHEEKRLGCTHLSDHVELRYGIVKVSDNSVSDNAVRPHPQRDRGAPSRDFIALVQSGTCGQKGEGKRISAVNRNPERSIQVIIERVRKLNAKFKSRSLRSYQLQAGGQKELGCNQQGNLTQEFYVLRTN